MVGLYPNPGALGRYLNWEIEGFLGSESALDQGQTTQETGEEVATQSFAKKGYQINFG